MIIMERPPAAIGPMRPIGPMEARRFDKLKAPSPPRGSVDAVAPPDPKVQGSAPPACEGR
jgi:hypothetical protein